jgi:hypothetical protein
MANLPPTDPEGQYRGLYPRDHAEVAAGIAALDADPIFVRAVYEMLLRVAKRLGATRYTHRARGFGSTRARGVKRPTCRQPL